MGPDEKEGPVKTSVDRILTTHTGSLPRPESLLPAGADPATLQSADPELLRTAVAETVRHCWAGKPPWAVRTEAGPAQNQGLKASSYPRQGKLTPWLP